jgi:hypothetical protein
VNDLLESSNKQLKNMEKAKGKAYVLDSPTIERVIKVYTEQSTFIPYFVEQCDRWQNEKLTAEEFNFVQEIKNKITQLGSINQQILFLAEHYKNHTIDKVLAMDLAELALAVMNKKIDGPFE